MLFGALCVVAITASPAEAASGEQGTPVTAKWTSLKAPTLTRAVKVDGKYRSAGLAYLRVDGADDLPVYSLSARADIDHDALLTAVPPDTYREPNPSQIAAIVQASSEESRTAPLSDERAAAYQVAIWNLTDGIKVEPAIVPSVKLRAAVNAILDASRRSVEENHACKDSCQPLQSTSATTLSLNIARVGDTIDDVIVRVNITFAITEKTILAPQYVNLRINGVDATVCGGEVDRVAIDQTPTRDVMASSCAHRREDPGQKTTPVTSDLLRYKVDTIASPAPGDSSPTVMIVHVPRPNGALSIEASWPFGTGPGVIFSPDGSSARVIGAAGFRDARNAQLTIDPDDFSTFQKVVQRLTLPLFTGLGVWGLALLALILAALLNIKDVTIGLARVGRYAITGLYRLGAAGISRGYQRLRMWWRNVITGAIRWL